ncbi:hypothetical protein BAE44_0024433, partial [Dichanthelium oligosanthes]
LGSEVLETACEDVGNKHEIGVVFGFASAERIRVLWFKKGSILLKIQRSAVAMTSSSSLIWMISVRKMMMASSSLTPRTRV